MRIPTKRRARRAEGERYVQEQTPKKARPGNLVTWAVDRVRASPGSATRSMQLLKALAFERRDQLEQIVGTVNGDDGPETVAEELGALCTPRRTRADRSGNGLAAAADGADARPAARRAKASGCALDKDPFVAKNPGAPAPFVFSFIRTDRKRIYSQVFVTLWDPRQVELHAMSGTVEPKSATGETGTGHVPAQPAR